jgi:hypothetical protein
MKLKTNLLLWNYWANLNQPISIFSHGGHLEYRTVLTDTILKGDHLRIISAKFGWDWLCSFRGEDFFLIISSNGQNCSILSQKVPKFELYKHNDELFSIYYGIFYELWTFTDFDRLCKLEKRWFQTKRFLWKFPIGSYVKLSSAVTAILVGVLKCRTQFWKRTTQESFWPICKLEKRGMELKKNLLLWNFRANLNQTLLKWSLGGPLYKLCPSAKIFLNFILPFF